MSKIKLGAKPETFKPFPVKFPVADGSEATITATFRYRTQDEYGQLLNESKAKDGTPPTDADGTLDFQALYGRGTKANAEFLFKALAAWDLDEPLSEENLQALGNEFPAAIPALSAAYSSACREGRLGN